ncbi:hypothetical protein AB0J72_11810 [Dactylosporangium sp. NPDC049742]|uniref:hypothetical protein n=1 Tax=Dactylosporangium sp. NPDC049742 TaxID=3154737 RepID=UPI0034299D96
MSGLVPTPFGYAFLPRVRQYSQGVVGTEGHGLTRVRFSSPVPLSDGLRLAAEIIDAAGRPPAALCACELRTPAPFTEAEFTAFAPHRGVTWHPARPPVAGLDFEMDCRTVSTERLIDPQERKHR